MTSSFRYRLLGGLLTGLLFTLTNAAWAEQAEEAERWLERMTRAVNGLSYKGTFVYNHQGKLETMQLIHRAGEGGRQERLYSLTGPAREIIRDNEKVVCILPEDRAVRIDWRQSSNPFAELVPSDLSPLRAHYRFELQGAGRVADRNTQIVAILPRDEYRYGYRLWIDDDNGLLLRSDLLSETGEVVEQLLFTRLEIFESIPDDWFEPAISGEGFVHYQLDREMTIPEPVDFEWRASSLPPGFELRAHRMQLLAGNRQQVEHLLFSDGLASVSVYIEPTGPKDAFAGGSRVGAVNAYGRWEDGLQFTVVGEVPAGTVAHIAASLPTTGSDSE